MRSIPFSHSSPLLTSHLLEIPNSGALNEISNDGDAVNRHIRGSGLVKNGVTRRALFFVIYQTGRHGPQNGFRLCLVHEGFRIGDENEEGVVKEELERASDRIEQGAMEFISLGTPKLYTEDL
ncbi:hypothetical protein B7494_g4026 [Chlorociboria aeruginascens]|nr:hypothetical protein B7494_g4026 [Chlorociboria aeruginascens]